MEALIAAYASDGEEEEEQACSNKKKTIMKSDEYPPACPSLCVDEEAPACVFIGPPERPTAAPPLLSPLPPLLRRERAASSSSIPAPKQPSTGLEPLIHTEIPWNVQMKFRPFSRAGHHNQLPRGLFVQLKAHRKPVTAVRWSPTHSMLSTCSASRHSDSSDLKLAHLKLAHRGSSAQWIKSHSCTFGAQRTLICGAFNFTARHSPKICYRGPHA